MTVCEFAEIELRIIQFATDNGRCVTKVSQAERIAIICNTITIKGQRPNAQEANDMDVDRMGLWVEHTG